MPGATDTDFFRRAGLLDTKVGCGRKDDAATVARLGFDAMMQDKPGVVTGAKDKRQLAMTHLVPQTMLARRHAKQAAPGSAFDGHASGRTTRVVAGALGTVALLGAAAWMVASRGVALPSRRLAWRRASKG